MANMLSPGVTLPLTDNTAVSSGSGATTPLIILATAQDKLNTSNVVAQYTTSANAGQLILETSQRSLLNDFGKPSYDIVEGTAVFNSEQNEHGLMVCYEALSVADSCYVMRANIDLGELSGSLTIPSNNPANNTVWLDTATSSFGLLKWDAVNQDFVTISTTNNSGNAKLWIAANVSQTDGTTSGTYGANWKPATSFGKPGDYCVVTVNSNDPIWYMSTAGTWVQLGSASWQSSVPAVTSNVTITGTVSGNLSLNGSNVVLVNANLTTIVADVNAAAITGVGAFASGNRLCLTANSSATNSAILVGNTSTAPVGIPAATYYAPAYTTSLFTNAPSWLSTDAYPAPSGSVWMNMSNENNGANIVVEVYNSTSDTWNVSPVTVAANDAMANYLMDAVGGGINIPAGSFYYDTGAFNSNASGILYTRVSGPTIIVGASSSPILSSATTYNCNINTTVAASSTFSGNVEISFTGPVANLISAFNSANLSGIQASLNTNGQVVIEHTEGGTFYLYDGVSTPLNTIGMNLSTIYNKVSNWIAPAYVEGVSTPTADPNNGTIWYYNDPTAIDILINTGSAWASYATVTDARGYNLANTSPNGVLVSASAPTTQSDGTALVPGDLWFNTSDMSQIPNLYRFNSSNTWSQINNEDHTSRDGIVFADARWSAYGNVDPGVSTLPSITQMLTVTPAILDSDAPSYTLYPRGTLLFNTRRSGMNVKEFVTNHFTSGETSAWVSQSGNDNNGVAYLGGKAQRAMVVKAMISAIDNSDQLLDEYYDFNLLSAPGYPELIPALVALNEKRNETSFIVADAPITLAADPTALAAWAGNSAGAVTDGVDGLVTKYAYASVYYPAGYTTDIDGNNIVVPPSFMALPTIIQNDTISYPWFAPAGSTRGSVSDVSSIGYVDAQSGDFVVNSISKSLRDVLYPLNVNPISNIKGSGIELYGQKTLLGTTSELSRINVARLVIYLREQLDTIGKSFIFEQNDSITRHNLAFKVEAFLANLVTQRAIGDYFVDCSTDLNTPAVIDSNQLICAVGIVPLTSAEFIFIPVTLLASGALTSNTTITN